MFAGAVGFMVLPILGFALLWAVKLIYARGNNRGGVMQLGLSIVGWLLLLSGMVVVLLSNVIGWLLLFIAVLVCWAITIQYRNSERLSVMHLLAISAQRGLPLHVAVRAFADERADEVGRRAMRLAELLEDGVPLPDALEVSKNRLPLEAEATLRLESETTGLGAGLIEATATIGELGSLWRPIVDKLLYLGLLTLFVVFTVSFLLVKVVPAFEQIFTDFDTSLPTLTQLVIDVSNGFARYGVFLTPLTMLFLIALFLTLLYYPGWLQREVWAVRPLTRPFHRAVLLRCLARAQEKGSPLASALTSLSVSYPRSYIRTKLGLVATTAQQGGDWVQQMHRVGLLRRVDVGVLAAAARVGNQAWAMRQVAHRNRQLLETRLHLFNSLGIPIILLCYALLLSSVVVSLMLPLIVLIQQLS